jgi:hypothetical protein
MQARARAFLVLACPFAVVTTLQVLPSYVVSFDILFNSDICIYMITLSNAF